MAKNAAQRLLDTADFRQARLARRGVRCRTCRLMRLVARFWLGLEVEGEYERLVTESDVPAHSRILARQIYGQLLMSRRLAGAHQQLEAAFVEASDLYAPGDYFLILRRNASLLHLPLSEQPHPPLGLRQLLTTAAVTAEFQRSARSSRTFLFDGSDTFG